MLEHRHLGRLRYQAAWALQHEIRSERIRRHRCDILLTVEHEPVLTAGRRAQPEHLLRSAESLAELGVDLHYVERGGDWTWHGPGQLVAYPIVSLTERGLRVPEFVAVLEEAMADVARRVAGSRQDLDFGPRPGHPGLWASCDGRRLKIGAVGVHVERGVTMHGLALNLDPVPWGFELIVPCGLVGAETSSLRRLLGEGIPTVDDAAGWLATALAVRLDRLSVRSSPGA